MIKKVDESKKEEKVEKKENKTIANINAMIKYYSDYKDEKVNPTLVKEVKDSYFERVFNNKDVVSVNEDFEAVLSNKKTIKLKDYKNPKELEELLATSKDTFTFLVHEKGQKKSYILDIVGFIILMLIGIGFIYAGKIIFGIVFILLYIALYLVTFIKKER